jgi:hypothetical protein
MDKIMEYIKSSLCGYEQSMDKWEMCQQTPNAMKRMAYLKGRIDQLKDFQTIINSYEWGTK